ncbi:MAG: 3-deoxy-manno-octulosonate cytidylyltransferase [Deltaproteobacteria bacterium]|nr:3-deoxy-manno-octulosonate cytidylyltransferase [Deltaproteobacteria bacterium]
MAVLICIPSRLGSTRLPRKPLLPIHGRALVLHVLDRARECRHPARMCVATDSDEIARVVHAGGGEAVLTDSALPSGTDRVAAVARADASLADDDVVLNFQGDQPLLPGHALTRLLEVFADRAVDIATLICPLPREDLHNPNTVKVVTGRDGNALYFSRATIPHARDNERAAQARYAAHIGVYAYRKRALATLAATPPCALEETEALEQLRALWLGFRIRCVALPTPAPFEINTPEDHARAEALFARAGGDGARAYELLCTDAGARPVLPFTGS